jgi:nitrate/nitrite transporter NarK
MAEDRANRQSTGRTSLADAVAHPQVWLLSGAFFLNSLVNYGLFLWLPKMLEDVTGAGGFRLDVLTAVPFVAALAMMVVVGRASDRSGNRTRYAAGCALATAVGLLVALVFQRQVWGFVVGFAICQMALRSFAGVFWAMPPQLLGGAAAATGIALINAIGNLGGFVGPTLIGALHQATGGYTGSLLALAGVLVVEGILILRVRLPRTRLNGRSS